ncbi:hypothetical protein KVG90_21635 [Klebsiella pneumoniae]|uniref:hypothetical protein n=1 Tax=Klebsiella pneumoniae TaxID=573 RepID=UPI00217E278C|nr:hypothetical protein [Klebsiella pneumoniae]MCS6411425.1 hypothetical protein [Klebsiella pneumoniae]
MRERPIIFNADMVRAVLDGRKTQTRRMLTPHHLKMIDAAASSGECHPLESGRQHANSQSYYREWCPFGAVDDRLWVRETFCPVNDDGEKWIDYRATPRFEQSHPAGWDCEPKDPEALKWRPSIHMPCWASRITLEITGVRVERLQDISEVDAKAEGLAEITKDGSLFKFGIPDRDGYPGTDDRGWPWHEWERSPIGAYSKLWQSIYSADSWQANPWVWVIEFKRVEGELCPG